MENLQTEKIAAIACGEKMYRVCWLKNGNWMPIWNATTFENFAECDKAALEYVKIKKHNVISEYVNMR